MRTLIPSWICCALWLLTSPLCAGLEVNELSEATWLTLDEGFAPSVHVLRAPANTYSIANIAEAMDSVPAMRSSSLNFGFSSQTSWLGLAVENLNPKASHFFIELGYGLLDNVHFFAINPESGSVIAEYRTGDRLPFYERPVLHPYFVFPLHVEFGQSVNIFIEVETSSSSQFPLKLWSQEGLVSQGQSRAVFVGSIVGIIFVLAIYNLFLFASLRDFSYLYMALALMGYVCIESILTGFAYFYFWPASPAWNDVSLTVISNFSLATLCFFSRNFLALKAESPILSRLLLYWGLTGLLLAFLSLFLPYRYMILITSANVFMSPVVCYVAAVKRVLEKYKPAYFYNLAFLPFVAAATIFVLGKLGILSRTGISEYAIHIAVTITVMLLSFALADRIKRETIEKEAAQEAAIENLNRYRSIYEASLEGLFRISTKGELLTCNPAFASLMGATSEQALLHKKVQLNKYIPAAEEDRQNIIALLKSVGHVFGYEAKCKKLDDSIFWGAIYAKYIWDSHDGHLLDVAVVDISEKKLNEERLSFLANHDVLTGLSNRSGFQQQLMDAKSCALETGESHALLFMDLDQFKIVNDTCGHSAGDELLKQLSALFVRHLREEDAIARLGGDEFVILLYYCSLEEGLEIADRLREEVCEYRFSWEGKIFSVGISIGIVSVDNKSGSEESILALADTACYAAKDAGRNRVFVHKHGSGDVQVRQTEMKLAGVLREAIKNDQMVLFRQNIIPISKGIDGDFYEILVRMESDDGLVLPGAFMSAAERFDVTEQLDYWVVDAFLSWLHRNPQSLSDLFQANINISGRTLNNDRFGEYLLKAFDKYQIPKNKLCFEITESEAISNLADTCRFLESMTKSGLKFSLDDFGAGFSSYSYLKNLPVQALKIDGSFIRDISRDAVNHAMVKSIVEVAHIMGLDVTAEFVESEEVLQSLRGLGVDFVQGYHIHMPEKL